MREDPRLQIKFRFGVPKAGWFPVTIVLHGRSREIFVSYTPNDALADFVAFLDAMLQGGLPTKCVWHCEPEQYEFGAQMDGERLRFSCALWPDHRRCDGGSQPIFVKSGTASQICLPLWRSFRALESRWQSPAYDQEWGRPFPTLAMNKLTEQVRLIKETQ